MGEEDSRGGQDRKSFKSCSSPACPFPGFLSLVCHPSWAPFQLPPLTTSPALLPISCIGHPLWELLPFWKLTFIKISHLFLFWGRSRSGALKEQNVSSPHCSAADSCGPARHCCEFTELLCTGGPGHLLLFRVQSRRSSFTAVPGRREENSWDCPEVCGKVRELPENCRADGSKVWVHGLGRGTWDGCLVLRACVCDQRSLFSLFYSLFPLRSIPFSSFKINGIIVVLKQYLICQSSSYLPGSTTGFGCSDGKRWQ